MEEPPVTPFDTQSRVCPNCGSKVSARAKTCLVCGADLQAALKASEPPLPPVAASARKPRWTLKNILFQIVGALAGLALLVGIVLGFTAAVRRASSIRPTPTLTPQPTLTPAPVDMAANTPTPLPTPDANATPIPPTQYTVKAGDTLSGIAVKFGTTVQDIQALNNLESTEILIIGQVLLIPPPGATPLPPTPPKSGALPGTIIHVVQPGETLIGIAQKYGAPMTAIQELNKIEDIETIKAGQQLYIPVGPTATPTAGPTPTSTPLAKYPAPPLLSPLDGAQFEGADTPILLLWAATTILRPNEWYLVTIERPSSGKPPITLNKTKTTAAYVPVELYPSPQEEQRLFTWRVSIVRQADNAPAQDASVPGEIRSFMWLLPISTPTPTPEPG